MTVRIIELPAAQTNLGVDDLREATGEIVAVAGVKPHVVSQDAEAVMLDFMKPARPASVFD